jgi:DNA repair protein RecN (Recombination protein N)
VIASKASNATTLVFDEVDSGIGGRVAEVVGRLMRTLGQEGPGQRARQVLAVTHLAQVAARANHQWQVRKQSAAHGTVSQVVALSAKERVEEIARMVGGAELTAATRKTAKEMLDAA